MLDFAWPEIELWPSSELHRSAIEIGLREDRRCASLSKYWAGRPVGSVSFKTEAESLGAVMKRFFRLIAFPLVANSLQPSATSAKSTLGPPEKVSDLDADPTGVYAFIVRGDADTLSEARHLHVEDAEVGEPTDLPLIDAVALALRSSDASTLSRRTGAVQVWYVPRPLIRTYEHVIQSLQYIAANSSPPEPINMSLGPPSEVMPLPPHIEEPMNEATKRMAARGYVPIFASGNYYDAAHPNPGVINPWCLPEWVICVGAAHADLSGPWSGSARGAPDDPRSWPDVAANGGEVLSTWPSKTPKPYSQRMRDEASELFRKRIPKELWNQYTLDKGTSQATAQVSRAAVQIIYFVQHTVAKTKDAQTGSALFSLTIPTSRFDASSRKGRLTGDIGERSAAGVVVTYRWEPDPWRLVKQLLVDSALPMRSGRPNEIGAGFISPEYIDKQFGGFGIAPVTIMPIKALP